MPTAIPKSVNLSRWVREVDSERKSRVISVYGYTFHKNMQPRDHGVCTSPRVLTVDSISSVENLPLHTHLYQELDVRTLHFLANLYSASLVPQRFV